MQFISTHVDNSPTERAERWFGLVWFVLFNNTWSQQGHSMSCMTILFPNLQITRSDIRPRTKLATLIFVRVCMG